MKGPVLSWFLRLLEFSVTDVESLDLSFLTGQPQRGAVDAGAGPADQRLPRGDRLRSSNLVFGFREGVRVRVSGFLSFGVCVIVRAVIFTFWCVIILQMSFISSL